jgi:hypothetical protein
MKYCSEILENGKTCNKTSSFGYINDGIPRFCSGCSKGKETDDNKIVNFKHGYCSEVINENGLTKSESLCCKNANFNYSDSKLKKGIRCKEHSENGMICINGHMCKDCKTQIASFVLNNSNAKTPTHCKSCADKYNTGCIDVSHKKCIMCNKNTATFGLNGSSKKEYCGECSKSAKLDVTDLHHKMCIECNKLSAIFNIEGEKPLYCGTCKTDEMVNIYGQKCETCNIKQPFYNYPEFKKGRFCKGCALEGMINVKNILCKLCNKKRPSFNNSGKGKPLYCKECSTEDMINIYMDICENDECDENAWYNFKDEQKVKYCKKHALDGMISLKWKLCIEDGCNLCASFNYDTEDKPIYCGKHALKCMKDITRKACIIEGCIKRPRYNYYGKHCALYCYEHSHSDMVNIEHKLCKTYLCTVRSSNKFNGYCMYCFINLFPDEKISRNYKTKETHITDYIKDSFKDYTWITDKKIQDGCSKRRPDLLLDLGIKVLIIEIDESQHTGYESICENKRLMEISKDLDHRPVIFIRFNPDEYINENNKKITSCWGLDKKGLSIIKKDKKIEWKMRLETLNNKIQSYIENEINGIDKTVTVSHLFFDKKSEEL